MLNKPGPIASSVCFEVFLSVKHFARDGFARLKAIDLRFLANAGRALSCAVAAQNESQVLRFLDFLIGWSCQRYCWAADHMDPPF